MLFNRDDELPYWRSQVDVGDVIAAHGHRPERAAAWLSSWGVANDRAVMMRGLFFAGALGGCTYTYVFKPCAIGDLAIVLPTPDHNDLLAISRHGPAYWGCVTGRADYIGRRIETPLTVHRNAAEWLSDGCHGVLPLKHAFYPYLRAAPKLVAQNYGHGLDLVERVFVEPAVQFGGDPAAAEAEAIERILCTP